MKPELNFTYTKKTERALPLWCNFRRQDHERFRKPAFQQAILILISLPVTTAERKLLIGMSDEILLLTFNITQCSFLN